MNTKNINPFKPNSISHYVDFKGCWMVFCIYIQILIEQSVCKQWRPDQTPHFVVSGLGLHCLPMYHKMDAMLIWVFACSYM